MMDYALTVTRGNATMLYATSHGSYTIRTRLRLDHGIDERRMRAALDKTAHRYPHFCVSIPSRFPNVFTTNIASSNSMILYIMFEHNIAYYYFKGQQARGRSCRVIRKDDSVDRVSVKRSVGKNDSLGSFGGLAYSA